MNIFSVVNVLPVRNCLLIICFSQKQSHSGISNGGNLLDKLFFLCYIDTDFIKYD